MGCKLKYRCAAIVRLYSNLGKVPVTKYLTWYKFFLQTFISFSDHFLSTENGKQKSNYLAIQLVGLRVRTAIKNVSGFSLSDRESQRYSSNS